MIRLASLPFGFLFVAPHFLTVQDARGPAENQTSREIVAENFRRECHSAEIPTSRSPDQDQVRPHQVFRAHIRQAPALVAGPSSHFRQSRPRRTLASCHAAENSVLLQALQIFW